MKKMRVILALGTMLMAFASSAQAAEPYNCTTWEWTKKDKSLKVNAKLMALPVLGFEKTLYCAQSLVAYNLAVGIRDSLDLKIPACKAAVNALSTRVYLRSTLMIGFWNMNKRKAMYEYINYLSSNRDKVLCGTPTSPPVDPTPSTTGF